MKFPRYRIVWHNIYILSLYGSLPAPTVIHSSNSAGSPHMVDLYTGSFYPPVLVIWLFHNF